MSNDLRQWRHLILTTYGAWLYGDARGFRTRHHREHVDGDYKNPPLPETYSEKENRSRRLLKQPAVVLPPARRELVGRALHRELTRLGAWVLIVAVVGSHVHVLAKLAPGKARDFAGRAKREATSALRAVGWSGRVWGVRSRAVAIRDRAHQVNVYRYIAAHEAEGAWIGIWKSDPTTEA